jgi:hypothetical protein
MQVVDELVRALFGRFPHTVLQFEVHPWSRQCTPSPSVPSSEPESCLHWKPKSCFAFMIHPLQKDLAAIVVSSSPHWRALRRDVLDGTGRRTSTWRMQRPCWSATATRTWCSTTTSRAPRPARSAACTAPWPSWARPPRTSRTPLGQLYEMGVRVAPPLGAGPVGSCGNQCCAFVSNRVCCANVVCRADAPDGGLAGAGKTPEAITEQRFAVLGAGSAGMGVVCMLARGMVKHVRPSTSCGVAERGCGRPAPAPGFQKLQQSLSHPRVLYHTLPACMPRPIHRTQHTASVATCVHRQARA